MKCMIILITFKTIAHIAPTTGLFDDPLLFDGANNVACYLNLL